jgi:hypothetical protein
MSDEYIKKFAQETLGCGCPEEVFQHIECQYDIHVKDVLLRARINIGNRLLIYIAEANNTETIKSSLAHIIDIGTKERDALGFNRFRLVLAGEMIDQIKSVAERVFKDIERDDKIHLHIISKADIPINPRNAVG